MKGLRTSSVLVVDNDTSEGMPLIQALSRTGVGVIYLTGNPAEFPSSLPVGVRLVFLDMNLSDADLDDDQIVQLPISVLDAVIADGNGPYLVILWTAHAHLAAAFTSQAAMLPWPPVDVCVISKDEAKDDEGNFDTAIINERVGTMLAIHDPLQLMMLWGQVTHDAAAATLVSLSPPASVSWAQEARDLLACLVRENAPSAALVDLPRCARALYGALDEVLSDNLDGAAAAIAAESVPAIQLVAVHSQASPSPTSPMKSRVNTSLLLGAPIDELAPGTIYVVSEMTAAIQADLADLIVGTLLKRPKPDATAQTARYEAAFTSAIPIAIELTAVCDHQQGNSLISRWMGGIALPAASQDQISKGDFVKVMPALALNRAPLNGDCVFAWNARFLITRRRNKMKAQAAFRMRQTPYSSVVTFQANYAARPGYLSIP